MNRTILLRSVALSLLLVSMAVQVGGADGGKAKNVVYQGKAEGAQFSIDTSPIIFYVGTVNNKYHVLLIRVKNSSDTALNLAKDQDTIQLRFAGGTTVNGLLNLPAADRATWDGLETEIRNAVAYPDVIKPREEEGIYLYIRTQDVSGPRRKHEMPSSITYTNQEPSPSRGAAAAEGRGITARDPEIR